MARTVTIDSALDAIPPLAEWVEAELQDRNFPQGLVFDIQVCLEEVLANIVIHGFNREAGHPVDVSLDVGADSVLLEICDRGPPFDPRLAPETPLPACVEDAAIGGAGLRLIRGLSQRIDYIRQNDANRLSLTFAPKADARRDAGRLT